MTLERKFSFNPEPEETLNYKHCKKHQPRSFHNNFAMAIHMTSFQKRLLNQLRRKVEKYVRARNQAEYLKECLEKKFFPDQLI